MAGKNVAKPIRKTKGDLRPQDIFPASPPRLKVVLSPAGEPDPDPITCPERAWKYVRDLEEADRENLIVLHLDQKKRLLAREVVSVGTIASAQAHVRGILIGALLNHSAGIIVAHNHPSGDPKASKEDFALTIHLITVAKMFDIEVVDHFVVGAGQLYSINTCTLTDMRPLKNRPSPLLEEIKRRGRPRKIVAETPEEEQLIRAFRRVYKDGKKWMLGSMRVALKGQADREEIVRLVAEGKPLNDEQADTWKWLRETVEKGEFTP